MLKAATGMCLGLALLGCEKKAAAPANAAQTAEVGAAQADQAKAVADKVKADQAVSAAKSEQEAAQDRLKAANSKANETAANVSSDLKAKAGDAGAGWIGPDVGWGHDWATFVITTNASADKGDYTIERGSDGAVTAYRKTPPANAATFTEMKGPALAAQVRSRLGQDADESLHAIEVDAKDHTVELRGGVKNTDIAGSAVRIALGTPGAEKVVSRLTWSSK